LVSEKVSNEISDDILVISDALIDFVQTPAINMADANYSRKNLIPTKSRFAQENSEFPRMGSTCPLDGGAYRFF
jgi:hypothetical protein